MATRSAVLDQIASRNQKKTRAIRIIKAILEFRCWAYIGEDKERLGHIGVRHLVLPSLSKNQLKDLFEICRHLPASALDVCNLVTQALA